MHIMVASSKSDVVRARIEPKVKRDAENILKRLGVSHSTFINMSYRAVVEEGGIPLSLHVPNRETAKVLREARKAGKRRDYRKADTLDEFTAAMKTSPKR
jgi:DNA-damage-inducible protein J